jgi:hypothetical protein
MSEPEPQPATSPPRRPWFQFSLRTLLLLFVVLGSSLAVFGAWGIAVFGLAVGLAMYVRHVRRLTSLTYPLLAFFCLVGLWLLWRNFEATPSVSYGPPRCYTELHDIAQALQDYHQANGSFPPAYVVDKNGKPLFSWRVLILPYLHRADIYKAFDFTEPWDGLKNKKLSAIQVRAFIWPDDPNASLPGTARTSYLAVVGANAAWTGAQPRKLTDFAGRTHQTIMVAEVVNSDINWAEPRDLSLETLDAAETKPHALPVSSNHGRIADFFFTYDYGGRVNVAMADCSEHPLWLGSRSTENLRKLLQIGGFKEASYDPAVRTNWPNIAALAVWLLSVGTLLTQAVRSRQVLSAPPTPLAV